MSSFLDRPEANSCTGYRRRLPAILFIACLACGGGAKSAGPVEVIPPPAPIRAAKWGLEWADEFNGPTLDPAVWITVDGPAQVNNEAEYYTPSEVYIENGSLVLRSQARSFGGRSYTSGEVRTGVHRLVSQGSAVEWRTQIPSGKGIWPANWLVASACTGITGCGGNWPPEIDVLEVRGSKPNANVMTHWWGSYPNQQHETTEWTSADDLSLAYHTYRLEWFRDSVVWYVDGAQRAKHTQHVTSGSMQLVMNTAVGGDFDGAPNASTVLPQYHRIDYVRGYRDTANAY
jgi:beta-glucanase (GH16 family)